MTAREKFAGVTRVRASAKYHDTFWNANARRGLRNAGDIVGFGRRFRNETVVWVRWDGNKTAQAYHMDYLEEIPNAGVQAEDRPTQD